MVLIRCSLSATRSRPFGNEGLVKGPVLETVLGPFRYSAGHKADQGGPFSAQW